jgi:hypothetical protein
MRIPLGSHDGQSAMSANESWHRFSRTRTWLWVLYGGLPILVGLMAVMDKHPARYSIKAAIALVYLTLVIALQFKISFWPCPHCGSAFFGGWRMPYSVKFFTVTDRKCMHCGLLWHEGSEQRSVTA